MRAPCGIPGVALAAALLAAATAASPKHILQIIVDDLGFSDLSYKADLYNISGPLFPTPFLDSLALAGVRLESTYVHALCSPSRGAFLSGRYAYTTGGNAEVITDGVPDQLPTNIRTIADLLHAHGWATAAFGKWDVGMTTWGCTPLCRGFDHQVGFYNADEDYFSHDVGAYLDLRRDFAPLQNATGTYSTELFSAAASDWISSAIAGGAQNTYAYLAFQAIHAPQQAPAAYLAAGCLDIPADEPVRRIACAQMRAVDAAVAAVAARYEALGIWDDTLVVFSADNGGNTDTGGLNWPLRGGKATMFEGGMRAASFVSGAGLSAVAGSVSHEFYSLVDWLPTLVGGVAGIDLAEAALPKHAFQPPPPPLDGMDVWASLSTGAPSPRTSALLYLDPFSCFPGQEPIACTVPGIGAVRVGRYKLIHGHVGVYSGKTNVTTQFCGGRDGTAQHNTVPVNVTPATSAPFCPSGWVTPPGSALPPVIAPPEERNGSCATTPCLLPPTSPLLVGGTKLFDVVADPTEQNDLAAALPEVVAQLLAVLQAFNATDVPQAHSAVDPASSPKSFGGVWTPWRGDPVPGHCDPNTTVPGAADVRSNFEGPRFGAAPEDVQLSGWAWSPNATDGGVGPLNVTYVVDGAVVGSALATYPRPPAFMNKTGAPNVEHGMNFTLPPAVARNVSAGGPHVLRALVHPPPGFAGGASDARNSPLCVTDKHPVPCAPPQ